MVPMIDPMVPEATVLLVVSPALVGVMVAFLAAVAIAIVGTARELSGAGRPRAAAASATRAGTPSPLPA